MEDFARRQRLVSILGKYFRQGLDVLEDGGLFQIRAEKVNSSSVRVASGHHAGPGWVANRRLAMPVGKQGAHLGQPVDIGGLGLGVTAEATDPVIQIVDRKEQDVWLILGPEGKTREDEDEVQKKE